MLRKVARRPPIYIRNLRRGSYGATVTGIKEPSTWVTFLDEQNIACRGMLPACLASYQSILLDIRVSEMAINLTQYLLSNQKVQVITTDGYRHLCGLKRQNSRGI